MSLSKNIITLSAVVGLSAIIGCAARTSIHSRVRDEHRERNYSRVIVIGDFRNYELREAFEVKVKNSLEGRGLEAIAWHQVYFPGDAVNIDSLIDETQADAVLVLVPGESGFSQTYIPKTTTSNTTGRATPDYSGGYSASSRTTTTTSGGYNVDKPWASFSAGLFDAGSGQMVWTATGKTGGNAFANWKTVVRSMGGKTVVKLSQDGMLHELK